MTRDKFEQLVKKLTLRAERSPFLYKVQIILLALAGYFYIYLVLGILLAILSLLLFFAVSGKINYLGLKIFFGLGFLVLIIVRSLWVKFEAPDGIRLSPKQAATLFNIIKELRAVLKTPKIHQVLIDDGYNAGIVQIPRFGLFGGYRNYLILGFPLLAALSPEQCRAVLAHELGHLSRAHGRIGSWVYRIRETWHRLTEQLNEEGHWGRIIFVPFSERFVPYFDAFTFVLRRKHEYEADRYASEVTSPEQNALALTTFSVKEHCLSEKFWPEIYKMANDHSEPVGDIYTLLGRRLKEDISPEDVTRWLNEELAVETDYFDVHPSLSDRLKAIGITPKVLHIELNAAEVYLDGCLGEIESLLNRLWYEQQQENWVERYQEVQEYRKKLNDLNEKDVSQQLTYDESLERACLIEELVGPAEALPYYEQLLTLRQDDPRVNFFLGRTLLALDRDQGVGLIEAAMGLDEEVILPGCEILWQYFLKNGKKEEASRYYSIGLKRSTKLDQASKERENISVKDRFCPHGISDESLKCLINELKAYPLKQAYLVQKETSNILPEPFYVLGISIANPWYSFLLESKTKKYKTAIVEKIAQELAFPGEGLVFCLDFNQGFKKVLKNIPGARLV